MAVTGGPSEDSRDCLGSRGSSLPGVWAQMHIRCCRTRNIQTFQGPVRLMVKLVQCRNEQCADAKTFALEQESEYAMSRWGIGWDVFCWIGQRQFSRHWSVPQIRLELADSYDIQLSDDAIEDHITPMCRSR